MTTPKGNAWDVIAGPPYRPHLKPSLAGVQKKGRLEDARQADNDAPS